MVKRAFILVLLCLLCFRGGLFLSRKPETIIYQRDTTYITRIDTLKIREIVHKVETRIDTFLVPIFDTLTLRDTLYQILPKTQKYYAETAKFEAWVSGYKPSLDSINIFQKTEYIKIVERVPDKRWGVGVLGGVGATREGLSPFLGVGVYYKLW